MIKTKKNNIFRPVKLILILIVLLLIFIFYISNIFGTSLLNNRITGLITFPFEKESCERKGGTYGYN